MALSLSELLEVWRRVLPEGYTIPLEDEAGGRGIDVVAAMAAALARTALAVELTTQSMYLSPHSDQLRPPASGGAQATGTVDVTRAAPANGSLALHDGDPLTLFVRSPDGEDSAELALEVASAVTLPGGSLAAVPVSVRATRRGFHGNVPDSRGRTIAFRRRSTASVVAATTTAANTITAGGGGDGFDAGMVGAWVRFTAGPNLGTGPRRITGFDDATATVTVDGAALVAGVGNNDLEVVDLVELGVSAELSADLAGGAAPWLDAIGLERGLGRGIAESDASYRARLRELPDVVSPNAIYRAVSRILTPLGIPFRIYESRGVEVVGGAWDVLPWDDQAGFVGLLGRHHFWQGDHFEYQGFYLVVRREGYGDFGAPWDYPPVPGGVHPSDAWDWMAWDGYALGFYSDLALLVSEIEQARAAGVPWLLVLVESVP